MKYSWEFKLEYVNKYKNGEYITHPDGPNQRESFMNHVRIWAKTYDMLGVDGLKHSPSTTVSRHI